MATWSRSPNESLFRVWPDLAGWLDESRELMLWKKGVQGELDNWTAHDLAADRLLSGARATEAERWLASSQDMFTDPEIDFLRQSIHSEKAKRRRLQTYAITVTLLLIASAGLALYAWRERNASNQARAKADAKTIEARTTTPSVECEADLLRQGTPQHSLLVAVESVNAWRDLTDPPVPPVWSAQQSLRPACPSSTACPSPPRR